MLINNSIQEKVLIAACIFSFISKKSANAFNVVDNGGTILLRACHIEDSATGQGYNSAASTFLIIIKE